MLYTYKHIYIYRERKKRETLVYYSNNNTIGLLMNISLVLGETLLTV